jgi:lipase maturation factor
MYTRKPPTFWLTRSLFLRALGGIYFIAFLSLANQLIPLFGEHGILPAKLYLHDVARATGGRLDGFITEPSIFWLVDSDVVLRAASYAGLALSLLVVAGCTHAIVLFALWFLYLSFVHIGQVFYGFGWEMLLLEIGFLAIFLGTLRRFLGFDRRTPPPAAIFYLVRWLLFRVMFGAGLIKLRGDPCWRDLTCLVYHYETQPLPNPLSYLLHKAPSWFHELGVLWNHFIELVVPFFLFWPRRVAAVAGLLQALFQLTLILSGNLSWLNWLTLVLCIACFDDGVLVRFAPAKVREHLEVMEREPSPIHSQAQKVTYGALVLLVAGLSLKPTLNLLSEHQMMNSSFDRLHLVNTYGAFGSVGKKRYEVILEGTLDDVPSQTAAWRPYEFKCKPGDPMRRPCVVSPYHHRLDWEIWFAAMSTIDEHPWLLSLVKKLLEGDRGALSLLDGDPFPGSRPKWIRADLYLYEFAPYGDPSGAWWKRSRVDEYVPPVSLEILKTLERESGSE